METRKGEQFTVGGKIHRGHHGRHHVLGRILHRVEGFGSLGSIVLCSLCNPLANQGDFGLVKRLCILALGHLVFTLVVWGNQLHEVTLVGFTGNNGGTLATTLHQGIEGRHDQLAFGLGRLMTAIAVSLKERTQVLVETHGLIWRLLVCSKQNA